MFVEPLAAACQIVQQVHIKSDYEIAVVGTGKLGILICQVQEVGREEGRD